MNKSSNKTPVINVERYSKSTFSLTFVLEIIGLDVWHDCNEGWLDLGTCYQALKLQYQLYPGQSFDIDVLIWPHVVKVWCGSNFTWARTWQFLERRWFAFSIRHAFSVRVAELRNHIATVTPSFGVGYLSANAKNDKNVEVYLPALKYGEKRYFAGAIDSEQSLEDFFKELIWSTVVDFIPSSYLDGDFDVPHTVSDIRHQDAVITKVQEIILFKSLSEEEIIEPEENYKGKDRRDSKYPKEKEKKKVAEAAKNKFEIKLTGDSIIAGAGRITQFETEGDRPIDMAEIIVLLSSNHVPANDDEPVIFVNVENLYDIPVEEFKKARISELYTRWQIGEDLHESERQPLKNKRKLNFNDHHTVLLDNAASNINSNFLDDPFTIEIRGTRTPKCDEDSAFYGQRKPPISHESSDILIATTKIDASSLAKGMNTLLRSEYSLFPGQVTIETVQREEICTNDINAIGKCLTQNLFPSSVILRAQMTLEVSLGYLGCKPRELGLSFSRLYCIINNSKAVISILRKITEINDQILAESDRENLLTGFVLDVGDKAVLYVEGKRHGPILRLCNFAESFYSAMKMAFSSSANYATRLYPEMVSAPIPFFVLKMYVPLSVLLACPQVYVRPTIPVPARSATLKFGRLVANNLRTVPCRSDMPSSEELKSFRLELCSPPKPGGNFDFNLVPNISQTRSEIFKNIARMNKHSA